ncbi:MAG: hypothetical protein Q8L34_01570 [Candidatus Woesearchaeota archaeon]|nr:hypothetical protein [Candidatus Woesearchaeota archaeon]
MVESIAKMTPEDLFLKYAFPCTIVKVARKEITQQEYESLEQAAKENQPVSRERLEKTYPSAVARMKAVAKEKGKVYFSEENIRDYFLGRHNELLRGTFKPTKEQGPALDENLPQAIRELCLITTGKIVKKGGTFYVVEFAAGKETKRRAVSNILAPDAEIGNVIRIHYGYAVEKVS